MADSLIPGILSTPGLATGISAPKTDTPQKTKDAAAQFEALLVGQILKSAHGEEGGWLGAGEDQTASSAMQMADEYLAKAMTAHGGLGLARMISNSLDQAAASASAHNTSGQTTSAHNTSGQTTSAQTTSGQTISGQTISGQTISGQTGTKQTNPAK
jgi:Rod binding domain-containing protein